MGVARAALRALRRSLRAVTVAGVAGVATLLAVPAHAVQTGSGSGYALSASLATAPILGLSASLTLGPAPTGVSGSAPADFNQTASVISLTGNLLATSISAHTLTATTQSNLVNDTVNTSAAIQTLNVALVLLGLQAQAVTSSAAATCRNGMLALGGTMSIAGAQTSGLLSGVSISVNPAPNTVLLNLAGVKITLNEQIVSGTQITVNAIHIKLTAAVIGLNLVSGDIIVSQSVASMSSCSGIAALDNQLTGWIAPVTVSNFDFSGGNATLYRPSYNKADWGGDLQAYPVNASGVIDEANPRWSGGASTILNGQNYDSGRRIVTVRTSDSARVPFRWASPGLGNSPTTLTPQGAMLGTLTSGQSVLNYLRGDRSNEAPSGLGYRARNTVLGDIVHSRPFYVDHPAHPRIYVGANDGMLHAFDANTGAAVFAYVPSMVYGNLASLAIDADPFSHKYYVDGSPNARKVTIGGVTKTYLVGALGTGGKGIFALDISDPTASDESAAANKILWEITPSTLAANNGIAATSAYANLGYTQGAPLIVRVNSNGGEWAAIVANGYGSASGNSSLFIISLASGTLIREIVTSAPGTPSAPSGLSKPAAIDTDGNGTVDRIYAGDVDGNMWVFDVSGASTGAWSVNRLYTTSPAQAITVAPTIALHPAGGYMGAVRDGPDPDDERPGRRDDDLRGLRAARSRRNADRGQREARRADAVAEDGSHLHERLHELPADQLVEPRRLREQRRLADGAAGRRARRRGRGTGRQRRELHVRHDEPDDRAPDHGVGQPAAEGRELADGARLRHRRYRHDACLRSERRRHARRERSAAGVGNRQSRAGCAHGSLRRDVAADPRAARDVQPAVLQQQSRRRVPATAAGDLGGGHFDVDLYHAACTLNSSGSGSGTTWSYSCPNNVHEHQYDDAYKTTGVNLLNASLPGLNLANAITSTTKTFRILVANQKLSPAVGIKVGTSSDSDAYVPVFNYLTSAGLAIGSLPTYTRATLAKLELNLPLNAFTLRDWSGTGDVRIGLVAGERTCVLANNNLSNSGPDPWMNGALTLQVVDAATTTDSDIELNVAGDPSMGYRLKKTAQSKQLAQYTMFFHASTGICYGDPGYQASPPLDGTAPGSGTSVGAGDPSGGYNSSGNMRGGIEQIVVDTDFLGGTTVTQTVRSRRPAAPQITFACATCTGSGPPPPPAPPPQQNDSRLMSGRMSWREMLRG